MKKNFDHITDEKLLALFYKSQDKKWLGILLERYTAMLLGVCLKYLKQRTEAEDAVQQVFLKTLASLPKTKIQNMGGWLYQVAKNECYERLRLTSKETDAAQTILSQTADAFPVKDWMQEEDKFRQLEKALATLNENQKNCIVLFYLKNKSYQEIATQLQLSIKEVKSHLQNGKRNLKIQLTQTFVHAQKGGSDE